MWFSPKEQFLLTRRIFLYYITRYRYSYKKDIRLRQRSLLSAWSLGNFGSDWIFILSRHGERSIDRPVLRHACLSSERGSLKLAISTVIATCSDDAGTPPTLQRRQRPCARIVQEQWAKRNIDDAAAAWLSVRERVNACTNSRVYTECPGAIFFIIQNLYFLEKKSGDISFFLPSSLPR